MVCSRSLSHKFIDPLTETRQLAPLFEAASRRHLIPASMARHIERTRA